MRIDGGCHCGAITYEAEVDPDKVTICHCTDCQTMSGGAFRAVVPAASDKFKLLKGQPKVYLKTAESGNKRAQAFCPECGTHLWAAAPVDTPSYGIRLGTIRQRAQLPPRRQVWCRSALDWAMDVKSIQPQLAKQ
jgi:hypothetical protein